MSLCMYDAKALCRFSDVARINRTLKEILQCFLVTAIPIRFRFYCHTQQPLSLLFRDCLPEKHCFYDQTWYNLFDCKIYPASFPTWFEKPRTITDGYSPIMSWLFVSANKVEYYCFPLFIITTIIPVSFLADVCFLTFVFFVTWPLSEVCHYPVYRMRFTSCWSDL